MIQLENEGGKGLKDAKTNSQHNSRPADRTRRDLFALVAINLIIMGLVAAYFAYHRGVQDRVLERIVQYHTSSGQAAQSSLAELHFISDSLWRQTPPNEGMKNFLLPGHLGHDEHKNTAEHIASLAKEREKLRTLQQQFADPKFEEAIELTMRAFEPVLLIGSPGDPTQGDFVDRRELIEALALRLQRLMDLHVKARNELVDAALNEGINDPNYLLITVGLLTVIGLLIGISVARSVITASAEREKALLTLRQNETRLAVLADCLESAQRIARIGSWEWDAESGTDWWSDESYRLVGFEPGAITASNEAFLKTVHNQDREKVARIIDEAERKGSRYRVDFRVILPDGSERYMREIGEPIFDSVGRYTGQRGTIQDITEQHLSETELAEAVRRLEAAHWVSKVADWEWDPDSQILHWSPQMREVLGLPPSGDPIHNATFIAMIHPEDRVTLLGRMHHALEAAEPYSLEYRFQCPGGEIRTILEFAEPFKAKDSGRVWLRGTIQDVSELRQREAELRETEKRFSLAFRLNPGMTAITEVETGTHVDVNDKWVETIGYSREEAIGRTASELGVWADPEDRARAVSLLRKNGYFKDFEVQLRTRQGDLRDFMMNAEPFPIGDRPHMLIVGHDITERKAAEEKIHETAANLENSERIANLGTWVWDIAEDREWWSDQLYRIFGLEPGSVVFGGYSFLDYVHPDDHNRMKAIMDRTQRDVVPFAGEYRIIRADGTERILSEVSELEYDPHGKPIKLRGTTIDITERKQAELALLATKERLEEAQSLGQMGSWSWDPEEDVEWWSDEHCRIFGLQQGTESLSGFGFLKYVHPDDRDRVEKIEREAAENFTPFLTEYRIIRPDGTERTVTEQGEWIENDTGGRPQWRGVTKDITERKLIENELARLNVELEHRVEERTAELRMAQIELVKRERLATLGRLTATVSHELRNPLAAIRTSLFIVEKKAEQLNGGMAGAIGRINRSITRCDNIIDELLDFTRMRDLAIQQLPIDSWLTTLLEELQVPEGISVRKTLNNSDLRVLADPDRLRRAVINIYDNACQAMETNEREAAASAPHASGHCLSMSTRLRANRIEIIFEDTGPGIAEDSFGQIFEPLFSTKNFGVGLGLPVVQQIMKQHGGGVEARNRKNGGAMFILWLPLETTQENSETAQNAASTHLH